MRRIAIAVAVLAVAMSTAAWAQHPATTTTSHPAVTAHAIAVAGQANAIRIEACTAASDAFIDHLAKGDYQAATGNFDPPMLAALGAHQLGTLWQSMAAKFGRYQARGAAQNMMYRNLAVITVPLSFAHATVGARLACGANGKFVGFHVVPVASAAPARSG